MGCLILIFFLGLGYAVAGVSGIIVTLLILIILQLAAS
jgi:hypothetical protein